MTRLSATDALAIVRARITDKGLPRYPGAKILLDEAKALWDDEMATWKALMYHGLHHAANCAWQRRTAAVELCRILGAAL